ncbi:uncharacterized protein CC84DRAFT_1158748 [Paraphaeosphaeria sporulosa]|uniref:Zn(2)-C6 fungal-type domain-containing protein n=1 Tax=Paraphaeosphaeria sporulosa TaxID=1460663 RepID=A0A177BT35_9PLEO|nr:uncharacterized protein CC84DRAFT_1158748 [Paraphaeosphaeria sporulosa]OAF98464.1 hypothetical protein CC84DRAFT_1158748 [Paraphaeosphaeria sporulosa]
MAGSLGCERCRWMKLCCFVDVASGCCAGCILVHAECSLFVLESDWQRIQDEEEETWLALLRARAEAACLELALAEVEQKKRSYAR